VKWDRVLAADAVPGSDDWNKLMVLVRRAVRRSKRRSVRRRKPYSWSSQAFAHYEQMDVLTRVREKIGRLGGIPGLWMLIPADQQSPLPVIDGKPYRDRAC